MTEPIGEDAPGTLVIRVTMNGRLWRVAFAETVSYLAWCGVVLVPAVLLLLSRPAIRLVSFSVLLIGWCSWGIWRCVPPARKRYRVLSMGVPTLQLDDVGVRVRDVLTHLDGAGLAWADCAAVVVSNAPKGPEWPVQPTRYVQFVPVAEDRVVIAGRKRRGVRAGMLGLSDSAASLVWLELPGSDPDTDDVLDWLKSHQSGLRIVGALTP